MSQLDEIKNELKIYSDFPKKGIKFLDISPLISNPKNFRTVINALYKKYKNSGINKIIAVESRGFLFASALALLMKAPLVMARKKGKLPGTVISYYYKSEYGKNVLELRKDSINPNDKPLVLDDVFATGGTLNAVISILKKIGCSDYRCCTIINLTDIEKKYNPGNVNSLIDFSVNGEIL